MSQPSHAGLLVVLSGVAAISGGAAVLVPDGIAQCVCGALVAVGVSGMIIDLQARGYAPTRGGTDLRNLYMRGASSLKPL